MERDIRRYILRTLAIHLALLALVAAVTIYGAYQVYQTAEARAQQAAGERQRLLARQTATGIEDFFEAIVSNLDLFRQIDRNNPGAEFAEAGPGPGADARRLARTFAVAPGLWAQLNDRATALAVIDTERDDLAAVYPADQTDHARRLVAAARDLRGIDGPQVGRPVATDDGRLAALVAVPAGEGSRFLLAAAVELPRIRERFLRDFDGPGNRPSPDNAGVAGDALLVAQDRRVISAEDPRLIGLDLATVLGSPELLDQVGENVTGGAQATVFGLGVFDTAGQRLPDAILTVQPVRLPGQRWTLIVREPLDGLGALVGETFWGAVQWAAFVIIAATAVLVSTERRAQPTQRGQDGRGGARGAGRDDPGRAGRRARRPRRVAVRLGLRRRRADGPRARPRDGRRGAGGRHRPAVAGGLDR